MTEPSASPDPAPSAPGGAAGGARAAEKRATLPRELADFLIEFSIALHKHAMYPGGHPTLAPAAEGVARRLDSLLLERGTLSLGVAREQLIIEGVATDPRNPVLKDLADRLHRHHLGAISFHRGVSPVELEEALKVVASDADRGADPIGLRKAGEIPSWKHLQLFPLTFDRLELVGGPDVDDSGSSNITGGRGAQLWVGLARAALASEDVSSGTVKKTKGAAARPPEPHAFRANLEPAAPMSDAEIDATLGAAAAPDEFEAGAAEPAAVARAIEQHERGTAYDQVIVGYLLQSAELLKQGGQGSLALKKKMSKLISSLDDNTRSRLLEMSGDKRQRNRFILDASQGMSMDAVVDLVNAAASGNGSPISSSMLRMLQKLSLHAERGSAPRRTMAESAIREQIAELVQGWELADPNPDGYSAALQKMSMSAPTLVAAEEAAFAPEAERMVKMSIETGGIGDPLERAIGDIVAAGNILNLVAMLDGAPRQNDATRRIRDRVEDPQMLRAALAAQPVDFDLVDQLVSANRGRATGPMLDVLTESESRTLRRALIDRLIRMPEVRPHLAGRVNDERWYVTRNILFIAAELPGMPLAVDATPFRQHADWRVRREALRVLFRDAEERTRAICTALSDEDSRLKQLALNAVVEGGCPEPAVPIVVSIASEEENDSELRVGAIKALGTKGGRLPLDALLKLTEIKRRSIIDVVAGSSASAEFLAAITALGALRADARARERLDLIARGRDSGAAKAAADALRGL